MMKVSFETVEGVKIPPGAPSWLTLDYIRICMIDDKTQTGWKPKVGDWYMCGDLWQVSRITSLKDYYKDPHAGSPGVLASDSHLGKDRRWPCDTYLPPPKTKRETRQPTRELSTCCA